MDSAIVWIVLGLVALGAVLFLIANVL